MAGAAARGKSLHRAGNLTDPPHSKSPFRSSNFNFKHTQPLLPAPKSKIFLAPIAIHPPALDTGTTRKTSRPDCTRTQHSTVHDGSWGRCQEKFYTYGVCWQLCTGIYASGWSSLLLLRRLAELFSSRRFKRLAMFGYLSNQICIKRRTFAWSTK